MVTHVGPGGSACGGRLWNPVSAHVGPHTSRTIWLQKMYETLYKTYTFGVYKVLADFFKFKYFETSN